MNLNPEDVLLLECIKPCHTTADLTRIEGVVNDGIKWDIFIRNAIQNRLVGFVYSTFRKLTNRERIPNHILETLQNYYYKTLSRNTVLYDSFKTVIAAWHEQGIVTIALKGIYLAECVYDDIGIRQLSDMDLLVSSDDAGQCEKILIEGGFIPDKSAKSKFIKKEKDSKHLPMLVKNGVGVEIHKTLIIADPDFNIPLSDFWEHTQRVDIAETSVLVFQPNYLLLHICMHLDEHFVDARIHFIAYADIVWIIHKYNDRIDWDEFDAMCKRYNCEQNVYRHLFLCHTYLGVSIPEKIRSRFSLCCDDYITDFFINQLQCNSNFVPKKRNRNITELKKMKGIGNKIRFLLGDLFPSKLFMYSRYKIKNPKALYWYYVVRLFDGMISGIRYLAGVRKI